jgi:hypothetical protein
MSRAWTCKQRPNPCSGPRLWGVTGAPLPAACGYECGSTRWWSSRCSPHRLERSPPLLPRLLRELASVSSALMTSTPSPPSSSSPSPSWITIRSSSSVKRRRERRQAWCLEGRWGRQSGGDGGGGMGGDRDRGSSPSVLLSLTVGALILTSPPPPLDASALDATAPLLPTTCRLEPFAEEEREYAHFRSREGDPKLSTPACGIH